MIESQQSPPKQTHQPKKRKIKLNLYSISHSNINQSKKEKVRALRGAHLDLEHLRLPDSGGELPRRHDLPSLPLPARIRNPTRIRIRLAELPAELGSAQGGGSGGGASLPCPSSGEGEANLGVSDPPPEGLADIRIRVWIRHVFWV